MGFISPLLTLQYEDMTLIPRSHEKEENLGVVACVCNPSVRKAEMGRSLGLAAQPV